MKAIIFSAILSFSLASAAETGRSNCQSSAIQVLESVLKHGNVRAVLPGDTESATSISTDNRGRAVELFTFSWRESLPYHASMRFVSEEDVCSLDLSSLQFQKTLSTERK